jgi:hypothetical protein
MTSPSLEWCEARVEARSLLINVLLQVLHTTPAGVRRRKCGGEFLSEKRPRRPVSI